MRLSQRDAAQCLQKILETIAEDRGLWMDPERGEAYPLLAERLETLAAHFRHQGVPPFVDRDADCTFTVHL